MTAPTSRCLISRSRAPARPRPRPPHGERKGPGSPRRRNTDPHSDQNSSSTDVGRIAIVICWDMWYPGPARLASLKQADIVLWPYEQDRHAEHRQVTARARAMDNGIIIVGASQATPAPIVDADSNVLAELGPDRPAFAVVEVAVLFVDRAGRSHHRPIRSGAI
jgi:predicted amidohydrolase